MRRPVLATLLLLATAQSLDAQAVLDTQEGLVEVRGLKRWTIPMLVDSLARYAPQDGLTSHACAAVLRQKLGFADAAVVVYPRGFEGRVRAEYYITVVEPQDSARVRYLATPAAAPSAVLAVPAWQPLATLMREDFETYQGALRDPAVSMAQTMSASARRAAARAAAFHDALRGALGEGRVEMHRTALTTLRSARDAEQRALAATVLVGWPRRDATWHALADALRDPSPLVRTVASQSLRALHAGAPRRVDWRPATATLQALLQGTNLFAFDVILDVLTTTANGAHLRRPLLARGGGDIVLDLLNSREPAARVRGYRFLRMLGPGDLGPNAEPWRRWMASL
jgi:hypothetical protein